MKKGNPKYSKSLQNPKSPKKIEQKRNQLLSIPL